jgi:tetratricopeptide (TPR) repeat protein
MIDVEECFHLALHAASMGQTHVCVPYLRQVLQEQPTHARALHLLAAQHAEIGLHERAITGMKAALASEPQLEIARFQLGLLLLDCGRRAEAKENLAALLGSSDPGLPAFAAAMIALADEDLQVAREQIALGLTQARNRPVAALMQRVLQGLQARDDVAGVDESNVRDDIAVLRAYGRALS